MLSIFQRSLWLIIIVIISACTQQAEDSELSTPPSPDTGTAVDAYYAAFNSADVEGLKSILAEELTVSVDFLGQASTISGRQAYLDTESRSSATNAQISYSNPIITENTFKAEHTYTADGETLAGTIEFQVEGGRISSITIQITEFLTLDESAETIKEPIGTPVGLAPSLAALNPGWTPLSPGGRISCALETPYSFWVRPGTSDKLLVFLQGGGYCGSAETCQPGSPTYDAAVTDGG